MISIKREDSIAKEVYQKIKYDILKVVIKDGDFLTLADLAHQYGVSKTPVRDALNELEKEGYLRALPRKGYLVVPVTQNDVREYFQMRIILEKSAVSLAAKYAAQSELEEIINLAMGFLTGGANASFSEFNNGFHMSIIRAAHNTVMTNISAGIMENLSRILLNDSRYLDLSREREEHIAIARALRDRDADMAESLIVKHISEMQDRVYSSHGHDGLT